MAHSKLLRYDRSATILSAEGARALAEFIAIHQTDANLLGCLLRRLAGKVSLGPIEQAAGVGFFQSDDVLLRKRPLAGQEALPERLADGVESEAVLITSGAVREPKGSFQEETTLPFRFKRWLFSVAGNPQLLEGARAALTLGLPEYLRRAARGESAAESLFLTFLSKLRDVGKIDDFNVDAEIAARALASAVGAAERAFEQAAAPLPALSVVVTNGRVMAALRRGHPLWLGVVEGITSCQRCELVRGASNLDPRVNAHRVLRAALVLSGPQESPPEGFRELNEGEIIAVVQGPQVVSL